jgi:signal transduction histidine kinase/CheY-like chemotaxis protein
MSASWNLPIQVAAEFTFAVIFLRALLWYVRRRDPLQRAVMLVFTPCTLLFCADVVRQLAGPIPRWVSLVTVTGLLLQPYLTLCLVGRLRRVPRWLDRLVLLASVGVAVPMALAPRPIDLRLIAGAVGVFVATETLAAVLLWTKARTRTGANRARLSIAAAATAAFGVTMVLLGIGAAPDTHPAFDAANRTLALLCGIGYLAAFLPPRWLRRGFSALAAQSVTERLLRAPADSPGQVWQTYADIMREQTGADAVAVLVPRPDGMLAETAYAGPPIAAPAELSTADLSVLISESRPARLRDGDPALVAHYGNKLGDDFVTALGMPVPPDSEGAVLLFNQHRGLFSDDDLRLLAALGAQAGILAERQAGLEAQRRLADELGESVAALTRANEAKSTFLANMSHELRTPLNAIIGFSDLMRHEEPDGDRRRVPAEWVEHVHTSGRHLLRLINDILDLAKVEAGRLDLRLEPLRVDTAVREVVDGLAPLTGAKQLRVETRLGQVTALADRVRFRQIMDNLLANAIKFTADGDRIMVVATAAADMVSVTIADTGVGIAPEDQARIFGEFEQVGDPERRSAGTGLGLTLTKRLVEAHGGTIVVESEPGVGSAFTVHVPAAPRTQVPVADAPADDDQSARVLLIEDDPRAAALLRTHLGTAGYRVEVVGTGESGLASAGENPPDAIVLDVTLPGIDGWEVIRRLKRDARLATIPVFFVTIVDEPHTGLALGADDYFVKPVDRGALISALARTVAARNHPRVLVVDHDDAARRSVTSGLRADGADVVSCTDGRDGLALSREQAFDLIVCDLRTPDVDGLELLAAIGQDPATRNTAVLGLTAAGGPLVATAMAGGVGWETIAPLRGGHHRPEGVRT